MHVCIFNFLGLQAICFFASMISTICIYHMILYFSYHHPFQVLISFSLKEVHNFKSTTYKKRDEMALFSAFFSYFKCLIKCFKSPHVSDDHHVLGASGGVEQRSTGKSKNKTKSSETPIVGSHFPISSHKSLL